MGPMLRKALASSPPKAADTAAEIQGQRLASRTPSNIRTISSSENEEGEANGELFAAVVLSKGVQVSIRRPSLMRPTLSKPLGELH